MRKNLMTLLQGLFNLTNKVANSRRPRRERALRLESLESRELLSASTLQDAQAIKEIVQPQIELVSTLEKPEYESVDLSQFLAATNPYPYAFSSAYLDETPHDPFNYAYAVAPDVGASEYSFTPEDVDKVELSNAVEDHIVDNNTIIVQNLDDSDEGLLQGSLREAVEYANSHPDIKTIKFAETLNGTIGLSSTIDISSSITIEGLGADKITIRMGDSWSDYNQVAFKVSGDNQSVSISGLTIGYGFATAIDGSNAAVSITLDNVVIQGTSSDAVSSRGNVTICDSEFSNIKSTAVRSQRNITITNSTIVGGVGYLYDHVVSASGYVYLNKVEITNFSVDSSYVYAVAAYGVDSYKEDDQASPSYAVYIKDSAIHDNKVNGVYAEKGDVYISGKKTVTVKGAQVECGVDYNEGNSGYGVDASIQADDGSVTIANTSVSYNNLKGVKASGNVTITSTTIDGGSSGVNNAVWAGGYAYLENVEITNYRLNSPQNKSDYHAVYANGGNSSFTDPNDSTKQLSAAVYIKDSAIHHNNVFGVRADSGDVYISGKKTVTVPGETEGTTKEVACGVDYNTSGVPAANMYVYGSVQATRGSVTTNGTSVSHNSMRGVYSNHGATITGTTVSYNDWSGVESSGAVTVSNKSTVSNNGENGVSSESSEGVAVTITDSTVSYNDGSGVKSSGAVTVSNKSTVSNNGENGVRSDGSEGGAVTITDSTVSYNGLWGVYEYDMGSATITDSIVSNNTAGGIYALSNITLTDVEIKDNGYKIGGTEENPTIELGNGEGGFAVFSFYGNITATTSEGATKKNQIADNYLGVYAYARGSITMSNTAVTGVKSATHPGADDPSKVYGALHSSYSYVKLSDVDVTGNAGLGVYAPNGTATISGSRVDGNFTSGAGRAITRYEEQNKDFAQAGVYATNVVIKSETVKKADPENAGQKINVVVPGSVSGNSGYGVFAKETVSMTGASHVDDNAYYGVYAKKSVTITGTAGATASDKSGYATINRNKYRGVKTVGVEQGEGNNKITVDGNVTVANAEIAYNGYYWDETTEKYKSYTQTNAQSEQEPVKAIGVEAYGAVTLDNASVNNNSATGVEAGGNVTIKGGSEIFSNGGFGVDTVDERKLEANAPRATVTIEGASKIYGNASTGVYSSGAVTLTGGSEVSGNTGYGIDTRLLGNDADNFADASAPVTISGGSKVYENSSTGVYSSGNVEVSGGSVIYWNGAYGVCTVLVGGVNSSERVTAPAYVTITGSKVYGNFDTGVYSSGYAEITNSEISKSKIGVGVVAKGVKYDATDATKPLYAIKVTNSTISENIRGGVVAHLSDESVAGNIVLEDVTIEKNGYVEVPNGSVDDLKTQYGFTDDQINNLFTIHDVDENKKIAVLDKSGNNDHKVTYAVYSYNGDVTADVAAKPANSIDANYYGVGAPLGKIELNKTNVTNSLGRAQEGGAGSGAASGTGKAAVDAGKQAVITYSNISSNAGIGIYAKDNITIEASQVNDNTGGFGVYGEKDVSVTNGSQINRNVGNGVDAPNGTATIIASQVNGNKRLEDDDYDFGRGVEAKDVVITSGMVTRTTGGEETTQRVMSEINDNSTIGVLAGRNVTIQDAEILRNGLYGVRIEVHTGAGTAKLIQTLIADNGGKDATSNEKYDGLYIGGAATATLYNCTIANSGQYAINALSGAKVDLYNTIAALSGTSDFNKDSSSIITGSNVLANGSADLQWTIPYTTEEGANLFVDSTNTDKTKRDYKLNKWKNSKAIARGDWSKNSSVANDWTKATVDGAKKPVDLTFTTARYTTTAANGVPKILDLGAYSSLPAPEQPSIIVTTLDDVVDAYDGVISLREAVEVYIKVSGGKYDPTSDDYTDGELNLDLDRYTYPEGTDGRTITFDLTDYVEKYKEKHNGDEPTYEIQLKTHHDADPTKEQPATITIDVPLAIDASEVKIGENESLDDKLVVKGVEAEPVFTVKATDDPNTTDKTETVGFTSLEITGGKTGVKQTTPEGEDEKPAALSFTNDDITGNKGNGIDSTGPTTITGGEITQNDGVGVNTKDDLTIVDAEITKNAQGGVYVNGTNTTSALLIQTLIADNGGKAATSGAKYDGLNVSGAAKAELYNCTIANSGRYAVYASGDANVKLVNTIAALSGKTDAKGVSVDLNIVGDNSQIVGTNALANGKWSDGSTKTISYNATEAKAIFTDAANGDYTLNAKSVKNHSPAIRQGDWTDDVTPQTIKALWPNDAATPTSNPVDHAGDPRLVNYTGEGKKLDLGVYRAQITKEQPSIIVTTLDDVVDPYDGVISLREAVEIYIKVRGGKYDPTPDDYTDGELKLNLTRYAYAADTDGRTITFDLADYVEKYREDHNDEDPNYEIQLTADHDGVNHATGLNATITIDVPLAIDASKVKIGEKPVESGAEGQVEDVYLAERLAVKGVESKPVFTVEAPETTSAQTIGFTRLEIAGGAYGVKQTTPLSNHASLRFTDDVITGNKGNGIDVQAKTTIAGGAITQNDGYGVRATNVLTIVDAEITQNAQGGVYVGGNQANATLIQTLIADNGGKDDSTVTEKGDGLYVKGVATASLYNCTIANSGRYAVSASNRATVNLVNTIAALSGEQSDGVSLDIKADQYSKIVGKYALANGEWSDGSIDTVFYDAAEARKIFVDSAYGESVTDRKYLLNAKSISNHSLAIRHGDWSDEITPQNIKALWPTKDNNPVDHQGNLRLVEYPDGNKLDLGVYRAQALTELEQPSIIVTTVEDLVDPYDGLISLREAVEVYSKLAKADASDLDDLSHDVRHNYDVYIYDPAYNTEQGKKGLTVTFNFNHGHNPYVITLNGEHNVPQTLTIANSSENSANPYDSEYAMRVYNGTGRPITVEANGASSVFALANNIAGKVELDGIDLVASAAGYGVTSNATGELAIKNATINSVDDKGVSGVVAQGNVTLEYVTIESFKDSDERQKVQGEVIGGVVAKGAVTVGNSTISNNAGLGVHATGDVTITNSEIKQNAGSGVQSTAGKVSVEYSAIYENLGSGVEAYGDVDVTGYKLITKRGKNFYYAIDDNYVYGIKSDNGAVTATDTRIKVFDRAAQSNSQDGVRAKGKVTLTRADVLGFNGYGVKTDDSAEIYGSFISANGLDGVNAGKSVVIKSAPFGDYDEGGRLYEEYLENYSDASYVDDNFQYNFDETVRISYVTRNGRNGVVSGETVVIESAQITYNGEYLSTTVNDSIGQGYGVYAVGDVTITFNLEEDETSWISDNAKYGVYSVNGNVTALFNEGEYSDSSWLAQIDYNGEVAYDNDEQGGGIYAGGKVTLDSVTVKYNYGRGIDAGKDVNIQTTRVYLNDGIGVFTSGKATINDSVISDNSGAGVYAVGGVNISAGSREAELSARVAKTLGIEGKEVEDGYAEDEYGNYLYVENPNGEGEYYYDADRDYYWEMDDDAPEGCKTYDRVPAYSTHYYYRASSSIYGNAIGVVAGGESTITNAYISDNTSDYTGDAALQSAANSGLVVLSGGTATISGGVYAENATGVYVLSGGKATITGAAKVVMNDDAGVYSAGATTLEGGAQVGYNADAGARVTGSLTVQGDAKLAFNKNFGIDYQPGSDASSLTLGKSTISYTGYRYKEDGTLYTDESGKRAVAVSVAENAEGGLGVRATGGTVKINPDATITENAYQGVGAANGANVEVVGATVSNNGAGAAALRGDSTNLYQRPGGVVAATGYVLLDGATISANAGAGVDSSATTGTYQIAGEAKTYTVYIKDSHVKLNVGHGVAAQGGTVYIDPSYINQNVGSGVYAPGAEVEILGSTVNGNQGAYGVYGKSVTIKTWYDENEATLYRSHVDDNKGIGVVAQSDVYIQDAYVMRNELGGVYVLAKDAADTPESTIIQTLIGDNGWNVDSDNQTFQEDGDTYYFGDGIYYISDGGTLTTANVTIANSKRYAIEIDEGELTLYNTIAALSGEDDDVAIDSDNVQASYQNVLAKIANVDEDSDVVISYTDEQIFDNSNADVLKNRKYTLFTDADNNQVDRSPAIRAGVPAYIDDYEWTKDDSDEPIDLVGNQRLWDEDENGDRALDLGAYRAVLTQEAPSIIVTTLDDVVDHYDQQISLREAIQDYFAWQNPDVLDANGNTYELNELEVTFGEDDPITLYRYFADGTDGLTITFDLTEYFQKHPEMKDQEYVINLATESEDYNLALVVNYGMMIDATSVVYGDGVDEKPIIIDGTIGDEEYAPQAVIVGGEYATTYYVDEDNNDAQRDLVVKGLEIRNVLSGIDADYDSPTIDSITLEDVRIVNLRPDGLEGSYGVRAPDSTITVDSSTITGFNGTEDDYGAGVWGANVYVKNSTITGTAETDALDDELETYSYGVQASAFASVVNSTITEASVGVYAAADASDDEENPTGINIEGSKVNKNAYVGVQVEGTAPITVGTYQPENATSAQRSEINENLHAGILSRGNVTVQNSDVKYNSNFGIVTEVEDPDDLTQAIPVVIIDGANVEYTGRSNDTSDELTVNLEDQDKGRRYRRLRRRRRCR